MQYQALCVCGWTANVQIEAQAQIAIRAHEVEAGVGHKGVRNWRLDVVSALDRNSTYDKP